MHGRIARTLSTSARATTARATTALATTALGLGLLLAPGPAQAAVEVGAEAVEVEAQDFVNVEPLKLTDLRGRLILLELFTTT